jgi:hypothetical protein
MGPSLRRLRVQHDLIDAPRLANRPRTSRIERRTKATFGDHVRVKALEPTVHRHAR